MSSPHVKEEWHETKWLKGWHVFFATMLLYALSLFFTPLANMFAMFILPLVLSYYLVPFLSELVFQFHRLVFFRKTPSNYYYRFKVPSVSWLKIALLSVYPFLFFMSFLLQSTSPGLSFFMRPSSILTTLTFPIIFSLTAIVWLLDYSGLRYVDNKNQYVQKIGLWFRNRYRGLLSTVVFTSIVLKILSGEATWETILMLFSTSAIVFSIVLVITVIYLKFIIGASMHKFEEILTKRYDISSERMRLELRKTGFFFKKP